jgi:AcrR family transcriptional regulator
VIGDVGLERARMEDVAAEAGVSRAAVYYHFNTKADLVCAIADDVFARLTETVRAALAEGPFDEVIVATVRFFADHARVGRLLISEVTLPMNPVRMLARHVDELITVLRRRLAADIAAGRVRPMDPDVAARAVAGVMRVAAFELLWNESIDVEHLTGELTDFVRHALAPSA